MRPSGPDGRRWPSMPGADLEAGTYRQVGRLQLVESRSARRRGVGKGMHRPARASRKACACDAQCERQVVALPCQVGGGLWLGGEPLDSGKPASRCTACSSREHVQVHMTGAIEGRQHLAAGDQHRAGRAGGQQVPDLAGRDRVVQHQQDAPAATRDQARRSLLDLDRDVPPFEPERAEQAGKRIHGIQGSRPPRWRLEVPGTAARRETARRAGAPRGSRAPTCRRRPRHARPRPHPRGRRLARGVGGRRSGPVVAVRSAAVAGPAREAPWSWGPRRSAAPGHRRLGLQTGSPRAAGPHGPAPARGAGTAPPASAAGPRPVAVGG